MNMKEFEMKNKHFGISSVAIEHERISVFQTICGDGDDEGIIGDIAGMC